jgi:ABC-type dipeptide/oligopeptide/nickel transport system permease component
MRLTFRMLMTAVALAVFGCLAVAATFFLVSLVPEIGGNFTRVSEPPDRPALDGPPKLLSPRALRAENVDARGFDLYWEDRSAAKTEVEISQDKGTTWRQICIVEAKARTIRIDGLDSTTEYLLRMRAVSASDPSDYSEVIAVLTKETQRARFRRWVECLVESRFEDWGQSRSVASVSSRLKTKVPVTAALALTSWLTSFFLLGPMIAAGLILVGRGGNALRDVVYPGWQALPSLPLALLVYVLLLRTSANGDPPYLVRFLASIGTLVFLLTPSAATIWLNALSRVHDREFVRVLRTTGIGPVRLWLQHILPNAIVSSGVLTQAAFKLPLIMVGSIYLETVMNLNGVAHDFITAAQEGQCELAAAATVVFFVPLAAGVLIAETVVVILDPQQQGAEDGRA